MQDLKISVIPSGLGCLQILVVSFTMIVNMSGCVESATTHKFDWQIVYTNVTRLCHTKSVVSVNGEFPGPAVYVREDDMVEIKVTNLVVYNVTIHWHGIHQLLSAWSDGTAYITQCPIQKGQSYVYKFQVIGQRGTLLWHAHTRWLRATIYGAFVILPKVDMPFPFSNPVFTEITILLGEWWNANVEDVISDALVSGGGYNVSDAVTINGQLGALYNCTPEGTLLYNVRKGETYLVRIANAAVNFQMFFSVANHSLIVVEADAEYTEPYDTDVVLLAPGQTTNVLLTASENVGEYLIAASIYSPPNKSAVPFPQIPATAILHYQGASSVPHSILPLPGFPAFNDTTFADKFTRSLRIHSLSLRQPYMGVPLQVDEELFFTIGYSLQPCPGGKHCQGPFGERLAASINNISFATPNISLLQAYYNHIDGVYQSDFPDIPFFQYNYTGINPQNKNSKLGTKVKILDFNSTVQIVLQDTATIFRESHPIHLHGQNFYIIGTGGGTYDPNSDRISFNLKNPPSRNTVSVPSGGWAAIRFRASNPGVWYFHCHLDIHNSWGMSMAFIVRNGDGSAQMLPPPPQDLPMC